MQYSIFQVWVCSEAIFTFKILETDKEVRRSSISFISLLTPLSSPFYSQFSDPLEFYPGAAAPSVPQPPSMTASGVRSIALNWVPPHSNGADIVSYTLEMEDPNSVSGM